MRLQVSVTAAIAPPAASRAATKAGCMAEHCVSSEYRNHGSAVASAYIPNLMPRGTIGGPPAWDTRAWKCARAPGRLLQGERGSKGVLALFSTCQGSGRRVPERIPRAGPPAEVASMRSFGTRGRCLPCALANRLVMVRRHEQKAGVLDAGDVHVWQGSRDDPEGLDLSRLLLSAGTAQGPYW